MPPHPKCKIEKILPGKRNFLPENPRFLGSAGGGGPKECGRAGGSGCAAAGPGGLTLDLQRGRNSNSAAAAAAGETSARAKNPRSRESSSGNFATWSQSRSSSLLLLDFTMIWQYFTCGSQTNCIVHRHYTFAQISCTWSDQGHKRLPMFLHFHPLSCLRLTGTWFLQKSKGRQDGQISLMFLQPTVIDRGSMIENFSSI